MEAFRHPVLKIVLDGTKEKLQDDIEDEAVNEGHYFEVMDRAAVIMAHFEDNITSHPVVRKNSQLTNLSQKTIESLYEFYSKAAHFYFNINKETKRRPKKKKR
jgi:hypothetical protein